MLDWRETAKTMAAGSHMKVPCCESDKSAILNNHGTYATVYCFRCEKAEAQSFKYLTFQERMEMKKRDKKIVSGLTTGQSVSLQNAPPTAWVWLLRAGLAVETAQKNYNISWSPDTQRIILPIMQNNVDTGAFIARSLDRQPKYLSSKNAKGLHWYGGSSPIVVVVEDILSAIRVTEAGFSAIAAMGTTITEQLVDYITDKEVIVGWFDADAAGEAANAKLEARLKTFDILHGCVRPCVGKKDPKDFSKHEIQTLVCESLNNVTRI